MHIVAAVEPDTADDVNADHEGDEDFNNIQKNQ